MKTDTNDRPYVAVGHPDRDLWERTCAGKEEFPTEAAAETAIKVYRRAHRNFRLSAYRCRFGNHWHIGN